MILPIMDSTAPQLEHDAKEQALDFDELHEQLVRLSGKKRRAYWIVKRTFDIVFSAAALLLLSPLFLLLAVMIYVDDPHGSPIYSQIRVGRKGKLFRFYKFRSMIVGADQMLEELKHKNEEDGPAFKMKDDPRITRVGKILRPASLDELPQLWNVLKGDMSLVGPRPALPKEVAQYSVYQMERLLVTPGLTCYWQTQRNRNAIPFDEWMALDLQYIQERSFWVDLKLIFKTVIVMLRREGM